MAEIGSLIHRMHFEPVTPCPHPEANWERIAVAEGDEALVWLECPDCGNALVAGPWPADAAVEQATLDREREQFTRKGG